jgi:RimJ/RimL family protein N-acetyltransferase
MCWLTAALADPVRQIFIAEHAGVPVGTVRADLRDGVSMLSWTVAPECRRQGFGREMVAVVARSVSGPIAAEVRVGNIASVRIAEAAGMRLDHEAEGILRFVRGPIGD